MSQNPTTLSEFSDNSSIRRTVNEYATSYSIDVPESIFDVSSFSGYIQYSLTIHDNKPALKINPNPDTNEYGQNTLLVTGSDELSIPRGIIEGCVPEMITEWGVVEDGYLAYLDILHRDNLAGTSLVQGTQKLTMEDEDGRLSLPKHPTISETPACSLQVITGEDGFEVIATILSPEADATPIQEATTLPYVSVPESLIQALGKDTIPVTVLEGGPIATRRVILEKYESQYGVTPTGTASVHEQTEVSLPPEVVDILTKEKISTGRVRLTVDDGGVLLVCDSNQSEAGCPFTVTDDTLLFHSDIGDLISIQSSEIHWHFHDGALIGETITNRPGVSPDVRGFVGTVEGHSIELPTQAFEESRLSHTEDSHIVATTKQETLCFAFVQDGGCSVPMAVEGESASVQLPNPTYDALELGTVDTVLCVPIHNALICIPMTETEARQRAGVASVSDMDDSRLHIPEGGRNAFVQQVGEGDPAVGLPREATEQFALEEGSKFSIEVGTYNGTLAMYCTPIEPNDVTPDVCLGRMLSSSNLRLPVQLVATLSLFERSITWGILWESDGPRLVGLVEETEAPSLVDGRESGTGTVYTTTKDRNDASSGTTHYTGTIPREAFDVFRESEHPPGVFIGCGSIEGKVRIVLTPVEETDLEIIGAVKLRDHWDDDYYEMTIPKSLAAAIGCEENEIVSWTFLDGQFVGTIESASQF